LFDVHFETPSEPGQAGSESACLADKWGRQRRRRRLLLLLLLLLLSVCVQNLLG
jgi:hypothetical protein